jgi:two-component system LytT family sensor kinase
MLQIEKILNSFFLRNAIIIFFMASGIIAQSFSNNITDITLHAFIVINSLWVYPLYLFHNLVLYKKFLAKRRYILYVVILSIAILIDQQTARGLFYIFNQPAQHFTFLQYLGLTWSNIVFLYVAFGIYLFYLYFRKRENELKIEHMKKELELTQLKQQFNPHFLFNALNNIYSYSITGNKYNGDLILKLGDLTRTILTYSSKDEIALSHEITFIENYIAFEKERLGKRCIIVLEKKLRTIKLT